LRLVLLGPPGAGKGTQARTLMEKLHAPQIASGDLLRAAVRNGTALGIQAKAFMDKGELVPDQLVLDLIGERMDQPDAQEGFILDGFPRSVAQAETLGRMLQQRKVAMDKAVAIVVPDQMLIERISGRRTCRKCGAMFHVKHDPPTVAGICNACGGELYQRDDDNEATVASRLRVYNESTRPLLDYYGKAGLLAEVDGTGSPEAVQTRILAALQRR
jgi:adenylate kinase